MVCRAVGAGMTNPLPPLPSTEANSVSVTVIRGGAIRTNSRSLETLRRLFRQAGRTVLFANSESPNGRVIERPLELSERARHLEIDPEDEEPQ